MKLFIFLLGMVVLTSGCLVAPSTIDKTEPSTETPTESINWKSFELTDINSNEKYSINDFADKIVLLESFAVWCPTCLKQQKEMEKLSLTSPEVIHISLDTDPNEDENKVREHVKRHGFDWRFSIPPSEYTESLIDEFGFRIVSAPSAPVVLICNNQSHLLESGLKSAEEIQTEINERCV